MLAGAVAEHKGSLQEAMADRRVRDVVERSAAVNASVGGDVATRDNFSIEWEHHEGDETRGMRLVDRVEWFFVSPIGLSREQLAGRVLLDAGCGNGSQSVAYTSLGLEVVALDLSSGLEHGRHARFPGADARRVHFIQGDLRRMFQARVERGVAQVGHDYLDVEAAAPPSAGIWR